MDIETILAKGWVTPTDLGPAEYGRAVEFWHARRAHDTHLHAVRDEAIAMIKGWTGRAPRDVGSFGTQVNLDSSDLDLGIGCDVEDRPALLEALDARAVLKGERWTSATSSRLVFSFALEGIEIDLSALTVEDFAVACRMLDQISAGMTREERIAHTWVKHRLREAGRLFDYARWKLVVYAKYCPEFTWVPIPETATAG
ncbi:MAG: hypothetical protein QG608_3314 [Actinomycetota bacterium]|nr:hypothetical protein [Actinomycetota bacterium]